MDYIIWKGIDSKTITGLLISKLPPISKPKLRVQETTIDGVDGSIIEELGYETYDKSISIGLTRGFDIDKVIKYFTGEGDVIFSNEPNKYYKAKIIEKIDYERLLRYRTATVKFRVQPFKYEYQEKTIEPEVKIIEGNNINITDGKVVELQIDGRSEQNGTPTPETPIEINTIPSMVDETKIKVTGKNLFSGYIKGKKLDSTNGTEVDDVTGATSDFIPVNFNENEYYYLSGLTDTLWTFIGAYNKDKEFLSRTGANPVTKLSINLASFISGTPQGTGDIAYLRVTTYENSETTGSVSSVDSLKVQLEKGTKATEYEEYKEQEVLIDMKKHNYFDYTNTDNFIGDNSTSTEVIESGLKVTLLATGTYRYSMIKLDNAKELLGKTLDFSCDIVASGSNDTAVILYFSKGNTLIKNFQNIKNNNVVTLPDTFPEGAEDIVLLFYANFTSTTGVADDYAEFTNIKLYQGIGTEDYYELCSIEDIKDELVIKNGKIKLIKRIGKVIVDGSKPMSEYRENEWTDDYIAINCGQIFNIAPQNHIGLCTHLNRSGTLTSYLSESSINTFMAHPNKHLYVEISTSIAKNLEEFKAWLQENNLTIYYLLAESIEIDLEEKYISLFEGISNITNNDNANMVIDYVDNKMIINNLGNHTSKPIFEIEGAGTIKFILNGYSLFNYTFDEEGRVVIDSEKEDAYLDTVLKNRNMNGEFPKLEIGENIITWDGLVKNIKATKKSRWL